MSNSPPAHSFSKRCNEYMVNYINDQRGRGVIVGPETEQFVVAMIDGLGRMLDSGRILDKGTGEQAIEDAVRSRDIPDRLEKFRLAHKNVFKGDEAEEPSGEITGPEYHKRMKAEAPGAFVRHDALDVRPEDLRLKHVDKQLPSGETIKVPLLQVLTDDVREKCNLPATSEVDKLIRSYLTNHARSRADYQKQLEKSKPYREVKQWKECHKRPDRLEAQLRLELIEEALKKGGRKMKKQVHKFPVHELEELANWLRRIVNESAGGAPPGAGAVVGDQISALGMMSPQAVTMRPPSPSAEEKRKRKSMG